MKAKLSQKSSLKAGLPPGTLVSFGDESAVHPKIELFHFTSDSFFEERSATLELISQYKAKGKNLWVNVDCVTDSQTILNIGKIFNLHPLVLEDILNTDQRPKLDDFDEYLYLVVKMIDFDQKAQEITCEQVSIIIGKNYILTFQENREGDVLNPVRERLRQNRNNIRTQGTGFLAYSLIDALIDHYFVILDSMEEILEKLEDELVQNPGTTAFKTIHRLKSDMILLRHMVTPLREIISELERCSEDFFTKDTLLHLRDTFDHTIRVVESVDTFRDMLSSMLDLTISSQGNKTNSVMKVLTIFSSIFLPLSFIAGVYGMNFKHMPELEWKYGYPACLGLMMTIAVGLVAFFKKKKWL